MSAAFVRGVLEAASSVPEVRARLPAAGEWDTEPGGCEMTVRLTGDAELRRLNREFSGEDRVTDVLSFPGWTTGSGVGLGGGGDPYVGDLAISWPAVLRQAEEFGHGASAEGALLLVHGLLHLLGWDHASPGEAAEMRRITLAALGAGGVEIATARL